MRLSSEDLNTLNSIEAKKAEVGRQRAIRAVVASQWQVAIAICYYPDGSGHQPTSDRSRFAYALNQLTALPTAEEVVDGQEV